MDFLSKNSTDIKGVSGAVSGIAGTMMASGAAKASGAAAANADLYNAAVASTNADIALKNADMAANVGNINAGISGQKTRAEASGTLANQGASGVALGSGSDVDVRKSVATKGMADAMTIRANAAREAYGYQTQASDQTARAGNLKKQAVYDRQAGKIAARTTMIGGLSDAAGDFGKFLKQGGLTAGTPTKEETLGGGGGSTKGMN